MAMAQAFDICAGGSWSIYIDDAFGSFVEETRLAMRRLHDHGVE